MTTASFYGGEAGFILKNLSGSPLYMDHSLTFGFNRMRSYLVLKNINEFYIFSDAGLGTYVQMITPVEHWFTDWLTFRGGPVFSFIAPENFEMGFGGAAGATVRLFEDYDIDIQAIYREKPSRAPARS